MACGDASLQIFDVTRKHLLKSYQIDRDVEGLITNLYCHENLIYALTHHSSVFCFDLRVASRNSRNTIELGSIWRRKMRNSYGLTTSICIDSLSHHWMLLTGSSATTKNIILWDLRFAGLEVSSWSHPSNKIIPLNSWALSNGSRCTQAFTNCTTEGEVSLWDLTSQSRTDVLWPSSESPLTYKREWVTTALAASTVDSDIIYTGDSEGSMRLWNLKNEDGSSYLCGPYRKYFSQHSAKNDLQDLKNMPSQIVYNVVKQKDSLLKIQVEDRTNISSSSTDHRTSLQIDETHHDAITDLLSLWPNEIVSSCRDGSIKLWRVS